VPPILFAGRLRQLRQIIKRSRREPNPVTSYSGQAFCAEASRVSQERRPCPVGTMVTAQDEHMLGRIVQKKERYAAERLRAADVSFRQRQQVFRECE
jgi:hypothetical protein